MNVYCAPERQRAHYPSGFLVNGVLQPNPEVPERLDRLLEAVSASGHEIEAPPDHGLDPIAAVHTPDYLRFLSRIHERWSHIEGASEDVFPNIHPDRRTVGYPLSAVGQAGYHMSDASCPIGAETWEAARWSANAAVSAATLVAGGAACAYALCRPPGHHAFSDLAGGFCYLNNVAIAAAFLLRSYDRVAIVDVDLHHGNGTQEIFYHRANVLTVSVHADPIRFYPFFWGYADERGAGPGRGYNLNLPLPRGSGDEAFLAALEHGLADVRAFAPSALLVALGLDAFEGDPFGGLALTTEGFGGIGEGLAQLGLPTVLVQEGGYLCDALGANLQSFIGGFQDAHVIP